MGEYNKKINNEMESNDKKKKRKRIWIILLPFIAVFLALIIGIIGFVGYKFSLVQFDDNEHTTIDTNQEFIDDENLDFGEIDDANGKDLKEILKNWATNGGTKMKKKNVVKLLKT